MTRPRRTSRKQTNSGVVSRSSRPPCSPPAWPTSTASSSSWALPTSSAAAASRATWPPPSCSVLGCLTSCPPTTCRRARSRPSSSSGPTARWASPTARSWSAETRPERSALTTAARSRSAGAPTWCRCGRMTCRPPDGIRADGACRSSGACTGRERESRDPADRPSTRRGRSGLDATPAARSVVGDDGPEHRQQGGPVDGVAAVDLDGLGRRVAVTLVDDAVRVGNGGVVDEDVDVIPRRQQRADVALEHKVGLHRALDGLLDLGVRGVHERAYLLADRLLPVGQLSDIFIDPRI